MVEVVSRHPHAADTLLVASIEEEVDSIGGGAWPDDLLAVDVDAWGDAADTSDLLPAGLPAGPALRIVLAAVQMDDAGRPDARRAAAAMARLLQHPDTLAAICATLAIDAPSVRVAPCVAGAPPLVHLTAGAPFAPASVARNGALATNLFTTTGSAVSSRREVVDSRRVLASGAVRWAACVPDAALPEYITGVALTVWGGSAVDAVGGLLPPRALAHHTTRAAACSLTATLVTEEVAAGAAARDTCVRGNATLPGTAAAIISSNAVAADGAVAALYGPPPSDGGNHIPTATLARSIRLSSFHRELEVHVTLPRSSHDGAAAAATCDVALLLHLERTTYLDADELADAVRRALTDRRAALRLFSPTVDVEAPAGGAHGEMVVLAVVANATGVASFGGLLLHMRYQAPGCSRANDEGSSYWVAGGGMWQGVAARLAGDYRPFLPGCYRPVSPPPVAAYVRCGGEAAAGGWQPLRLSPPDAVTNMQPVPVGEADAYVAVAAATAAVLVATAAATLTFAARTAASAGWAAG